MPLSFYVTYFMLQPPETIMGIVVFVILGIALLAAEFHLPTRGELGTFGGVLLILAAMLVFDATRFEFILSNEFLTALGVLAALVIGVAFYFAQRTAKMHKQHDLALLKHNGKVVKVESDGLHGQMEIQGEIWSFVSDVSVSVNDLVRVEKRHGLEFFVRRI